MFEKLIKKILRRNKHIMSFRQSVELTGLAIVTFYQEDTPLNFILDTGSTENIIDARLLSEIKHEPQKNKFSLYGIEGQSVEVKSCMITLSYDDKDYPYRYLIQDDNRPFDKFKKDYGVTIHGFIGSSFFRKYKYVINFKKLEAHSE